MWTYQQIGKLITPEGQPSAHQWYSGNGVHANKPQDEGLKGLGPIPRGRYTFGGFIDYKTQLGPVAFHLIPDDQTRAFILSLGRDPNSFFCHDGDTAHNYLASDGCLVCMAGSVGVLSMWNSGDHELLVESGLPAGFDFGPAFHYPD